MVNQERDIVEKRKFKTRQVSCARRRLNGCVFV